MLTSTDLRGKMITAERIIRRSVIVMLNGISKQVCDRYLEYVLFI